MKKLLIAVAIMVSLASCNVEYAISKTNCKVYTYGSIEADKGGVCIECDSLKRDAVFLANHFPTFKKKLTTIFNVAAAPSPIAVTK